MNQINGRLQAQSAVHIVYRPNSAAISTAIPLLTALAAEKIPLFAAQRKSVINS